MFEAHKRYTARVIVYPCCGLNFCSCKPSRVVLTVLKVTDSNVWIKAVPEMKVTSATKRCKLKHDGTVFEVTLQDNSDQHKRMVKTTVNHTDLTSDDEDDHTPLSIIAQRITSERQMP